MSLAGWTRASMLKPLARTSGQGTEPPQALQFLPAGGFTGTGRAGAGAGSLLLRFSDVGNCLSTQGTLLGLAPTGKVFLSLFCVDPSPRIAPIPRYVLHHAVLLDLAKTNAVLTLSRRAVLGITAKFSSGSTAGNNGWNPSPMLLSDASTPLKVSRNSAPRHSTSRLAAASLSFVKASARVDRASKGALDARTTRCAEPVLDHRSPHEVDGCRLDCLAWNRSRPIGRSKANLS